jgi:rhamnose transport system permease protein
VKLSSLLRRREVALAAIIMALLAAIGIRAPIFLTPPSLLGVLTDTSFLFMLTLGQANVLLTRGIDMSVAANLALTGTIACLASRAAPGLPIPVIIALALAVGLLLGLVNGLFVAFVGIPPIVVTLGTMAIYRGTIFTILGGAWLTQSDMSPAFLRC